MPELCGQSCCGDGSRSTPDASSRSAPWPSGDGSRTAGGRPPVVDAHQQRMRKQPATPRQLESCLRGGTSPNRLVPREERSNPCRLRLNALKSLCSGWPGGPPVVRSAVSSTQAQAGSCLLWLPADSDSTMQACLPPSHHRTDVRMVPPGPAAAVRSANLPGRRNGDRLACQATSRHLIAGYRSPLSFRPIAGSG
jgi:hypothetical protein